MACPITYGGHNNEQQQLFCDQYTSQSMIDSQHSQLITAGNFDNLKTFSVDFCTWYAECPPYFYFRSSWPTDLETVICFAPHDENFREVWSWYNHLLPSYIILDADGLRDLVTFNLFEISHWSYMTGNMSTPALSLKLPRLPVLDLWVLTLVH